MSTVDPTRGEILYIPLYTHSSKPIHEPWIDLYLVAAFDEQDLEISFLLMVEPDHS